MNKAEIDGKQNNELYIVGGAYRVDKFYVIDYILEKENNLKIINTGKLIKNIINNMQLPEFGNLPLQDYFRFVEPNFINEINTHLQYKNILLDTNYYYLIPGMSTKALKKIGKNTSKITLILIEENLETILTKKDFDENNKWYQECNNIKENAEANKDYFEIYAQILEKTTPVKKIILNKDDIYRNDKILREGLDKLIGNM